MYGQNVGFEQGYGAVMPITSKVCSLEWNEFRARVRVLRWQLNRVGFCFLVVYLEKDQAHP